MTTNFRSYGAVQSPENYNTRTNLPEKGGLYCEEIFGAVSWQANEMAFDRDDRSELWGHIELLVALAFAGNLVTKVALVPPVYRKFLPLDAAQHRAKAKARRAELHGLSLSGAWPYCDPVEKIFGEEGLEDEAALDHLEGGAEEPRLNVAYRNIVQHARTFAKMRAYNVPEVMLAELHATLTAAMVRLEEELHLADMPEPVRRQALAPMR